MLKLDSRKIRFDCVARVVLRIIKEIREKEPERQIVYTDETWLNSGHRVKKEWIDLMAQSTTWGRGGGYLLCWGTRGFAIFLGIPFTRKF